MSPLSLRLPDSIHRHIKDIAKRKGVSTNPLISSAVAEKISAFMTEESMATRVTGDRATSVSYGRNDTLTTPLLPDLSIPVQDIWP
jgi:hypothetical protein